MSYRCERFTFPSSDGINTVSARAYVPENTDIVGIVTLSHGMRDYVGRYVNLAEYLTEKGYILAGNDHLGHGETAASAEDLGYFAAENGYSFVLDDLYKMNGEIKARYPGLPVVLMGHSMGSFLSRLYAEKYPDSIDGIIIHGTGGRNPLLSIGKMLISLIRRVKGDRHRSPLVTGIAFGSYNKGFDKSEGAEAWLTRDGEQIKGRDTDPYCAFTFTAAGYADLFNMIGLCNSDAHFAAYPKGLPTLILSGEDDPVGDRGKGVRFVYGKLSEAGVEKLAMKLYPGARHELFNETNRQEVFDDMYGWLSEVAVGK